MLVHRRGGRLEDVDVVAPHGTNDRAELAVGESLESAPHGHTTEALRHGLRQVGVGGAGHNAQRHR